MQIGTSHHLELPTATAAQTRDLSAASLDCEAGRGDLGGYCRVVGFLPDGIRARPILGHPRRTAVAAAIGRLDRFRAVVSHEMASFGCGRLASWSRRHVAAASFSTRWRSVVGHRGAGPQRSGTGAVGISLPRRDATGGRGSARLRLPRRRTPSSASTLGLGNGRCFDTPPRRH